MTGTVALIKPDKRLCRTRIFITTLPFSEEELKNVKVLLTNPVYQYKVNKKGKLDIDVMAEDYIISD